MEVAPANLRMLRGGGEVSGGGRDWCGFGLITPRCSSDFNRESCSARKHFLYSSATGEVYLWEMGADTREGSFEKNSRALEFPPISMYSSLS